MLIWEFQLPQFSDRLIKAGLLLLASLAVSVPANAQPQDRLRLELPIDCDPGNTCWIVNYVDHDPNVGVRDYMCGTATYDLPDGSGHKGTDFAIRDIPAMDQGISVLAAANGVVKAIRDEMADIAIDDDMATMKLRGRDCGNGVVIDHGNGWTTQYCHLKQGSVSVRSGQHVDTGQKLGDVGLSGFTQFPHAHFTVRKDDQVIDPFVGETRSGKCGPGPARLWTPETLARLPYQPTALYNVGFAPGKPTRERIRNGDYSDSTLKATSGALVLWTEIFNVRAGDQVTLRILTPAGKELIGHTETLKKDQAWRFLFAGRPLKAAAWPTGRYRGEATLTRTGADGKDLTLHQVREVSVE